MSWLLRPLLLWCTCAQLPPGGRLCLGKNGNPAWGVLSHSSQTSFSVCVCTRACVCTPCCTNKNYSSEFWLFLLTGTASLYSCSSLLCCFLFWFFFFVFCLWRKSSQRMGETAGHSHTGPRRVTHREKQGALLCCLQRSLATLLLTLCGVA